jgi:hypothetical protein
MREDPLTEVRKDQLTALLASFPKEHPSGIGSHTDSGKACDQIVV